jgi:hypothetical protein
MDEGGITRWDLGLGLPSRYLEVELNSTRAVSRNGLIGSTDGRTQVSLEFEGRDFNR